MQRLGPHGLQINKCVGGPRPDHHTVAVLCPSFAAELSMSVEALSSRVDALERKSWGSPADSGGDGISEALRRARRHVEQAGCYSSIWKRCPANYYDLGLEERRKILSAHSTSQLCKACLFENKNFKPNEDGMKDPTNSQYYLVVVQYVEEVNFEKLSSGLRALRPVGSTRFGPKYFDFRQCDEFEKLTGYGHNGVSPFGLVDESIPIVLCKNVQSANPQFIWMGGGHKDWKLGMAVSEFVKGLGALVLDASDPR